MGIYVYPVPNCRISSVHPWPTRECWAGNQSYSLDKTDQERTRDPWAEGSAHQDPSGLPTSDIIAGRLSDDTERRYI